MTRPLFRDEVLQAQQGAWLGRVQLLRHLSLDLMLLAVLAMALAVAAFLVGASYTRKATAAGVLVQGADSLYVQSHTQSHSQFHAQLQSPSRAVSFVQPGHVVRLRLEAFPYQTFGLLEGRVLQVSRAPAASASPVIAGEAQAHITVALDAAAVARWPQPLQAGMRLQAEVLGERRRLIEWLFLGFNRSQ